MVRTFLQWLFSFIAEINLFSLPAGFKVITAISAQTIKVDAVIIITITIIITIIVPAAIKAFLVFPKAIKT